MARSALHRTALLAPFFALAGLALLGALTSPDPRGLGTHEQLGFAPCSFAEDFGVPCPTCGVTTSVSHIARGEFIDAWRVHPFGVLAVAATLVAAVLAFRAHRRGRDLGDTVSRRGGTWLLWIFVALATIWALRGAGPAPCVGDPSVLDLR